MKAGQELAGSTGRLLATFLTNAIDLESVAAGSVVVLAADLLLQLVNLRREELDRAPTIGADHVVVAASVVLVLVTGDAVVEGDLACQSALGEQLESTVDGSKSDLRVFLFHQPMEFVRRHVVAGLKEGLQDGV